MKDSKINSCRLDQLSDFEHLQLMTGFIRMFGCEAQYVFCNTVFYKQLFEAVVVEDVYLQMLNELTNEKQMLEKFDLKGIRSFTDLAFFGLISSITSSSGMLLMMEEINNHVQEESNSYVQITQKHKEMYVFFSNYLLQNNTN